MPNYRIPDALESYEESLRFEHHDLPELDRYELWQERERVKLALVGTPKRDEFRCRWLLERLAAIRREWELRREIKR
jgi:hypothetical protein